MKFLLGLDILVHAGRTVPSHHINPLKVDEIGQYRVCCSEDSGPSGPLTQCQCLIGNTVDLCESYKTGSRLRIQQRIQSCS